MDGTYHSPVLFLWSSTSCPFVLFANFHYGPHILPVRNGLHSSNGSKSFGQSAAPCRKRKVILMDLDAGPTGNSMHLCPGCGQATQFEKCRDCTEAQEEPPIYQPPLLCQVCHKPSFSPGGHPSCNALLFAEQSDAAWIAHRQELSKQKRLAQEARKAEATARLGQRVKFCPSCSEPSPIQSRSCKSCGKAFQTGKSA